MPNNNGQEVISPEQDWNHANILVAEDDDVFRNMLMRHLTRLEYSVVGVEDGTQAIQALEKDRFELLIVDLNMPGESGMDVIKSAQNIDPSMQVIVVTGEGSVENAIEALRSRVFDFLTKPLDSLKSFERTVNDALEKRFLESQKDRFLVDIVQMARKAEIDPLTGLHNRLNLNEKLEEEIQRSKRSISSFSLIMMDLDSLKLINDTHGHSIGDEVLRQVAKVIQAESRELDLPVRYGGDEFLIVMPGTDVQNAVELAARLSDKIENLDMFDMPISASIGVVGWDESYSSIAEILHAVDQAMYQSKENKKT